MSKIGRSLKKLIKHKKPEICMAAGVIFGAAAVVTACVQTKKGLDKVVDDHNARIKKARALPDDDPKKGREIMFAYGKTVGAGARLYAGPLVLFTASTLSFFTAHHTMKLRNAGLAATAAGLKKTLEDYRCRVADSVGEEAEERLYFGTKEGEIEESVIDENGDEKFETVLADDIVDDIERSDFVKYLVKGNEKWDRSPDMVRFTLECQQNLANDILKNKGEITLNEVYDLLGFEHTEAGMVYGWIYDKYNPFGDNKVEFRVKRVHVPNENGHGYSIGYAIDFNVDGNIYKERLKRRKLSKSGQR